MYNLGSIWMVFTLYMVMALLAIDFLRGVAALGTGAGLQLYPLREWLRGAGTLVAFAFTLVLLIYGYINYRNPKVEEVAIELGNRSGAGGGNDNGKDLWGGKKVRIVAVSDVHLGYATQKRDLQRYVERINSLTPDIILIAGDLIDNSVKPLREQRMQEEIGQLRAPMGIFMVPGNHEYISGMDEAEEFLGQTPVVLLRDSVAVLPCGVAIVGRDDRSNRERLTVEELLGKISAGARDEAATDAADATTAGTVVADRTPDGSPGGERSLRTSPHLPVILLDHQPYGIAQKDSLGVDVQFSGHTHRGQVWPMSIMVDRMYEQSHGYRKWPNSHVIVSSGLSLWGPPFRIGTNSDLWVINLTL